MQSIAATNAPLPHESVIAHSQALANRPTDISERSQSTVELRSANDNIRQSSPPPQDPNDPKIVISRRCRLCAFVFLILGLITFVTGIIIYCVSPKENVDKGVRAKVGVIEMSIGSTLLALCISFFVLLYFGKESSLICYKRTTFSNNEDQPPPPTLEENHELNVISTNGDLIPSAFRDTIPVSHNQNTHYTQVDEQPVTGVIVPSYGTPVNNLLSLQRRRLICSLFIVCIGLVVICSGAVLLVLSQKRSPPGKPIDLGLLVPGINHTIIGVAFCLVGFLFIYMILAGRENALGCFKSAPLIAIITGIVLETDPYQEGAYVTG